MVGTLDNPVILVDVANVVTVDKEGSLDAGLLQVVEQLVGELVWTVVKGHGNGAGDTAGGDDAVFAFLEMLKVGILGEFRVGGLGSQDWGGDDRGLSDHGYREQGCCNTGKAEEWCHCDI